MAGTSYPKTGVSTTEEQFSALIEFFAGTGVKDDASLKVTADGSGMNVKVAAGSALVRGMLYVDTVLATLTVTAAPAAGQSRIDTVVLERNLANTPNVQLKIVNGAVATTGSQVAATLTQAVPGVWQEPLAYILVTGGVVSITSGVVTDRRRLMGAQIRSWTTDNRPAHIVGVVQLGYNRSTSRWEFSNGSSWKNVTMTRDELRAAAGIFVQSSALTAANAVGDIRFATS